MVLIGHQRGCLRTRTRRERACCSQFTPAPVRAPFCSSSLLKAPYVATRSSELPTLMPALNSLRHIGVRTSSGAPRARWQQTSISSNFVTSESRTTPLRFGVRRDGARARNPPTCHAAILEFNDRFLPKFWWIKLRMQTAWPPGPVSILQETGPHRYHCPESIEFSHAP